MNTRFTASLILLVFCLAGLADEKQRKKGDGTAEDKPEKVAKSKAEEAAQATVKGEFGKLADLTYPKLIELGGGRERVIAAMESGLKEMKAKGFEYRSAKVGDPSPLVAGNSAVYTVVPFTLEMKAPTGRISMKSFLIGISADKGKTWTFVDGYRISNDEKLKKKLLPDLPEKLKLPKTEKPVIHKDK